MDEKVAAHNSAGFSSFFVARRIVLLSRRIRRHTRGFIFFLSLPLFAVGVRVSRGQIGRGVEGGRKRESERRNVDQRRPSLIHAN